MELKELLGELMEELHKVSRTSALVGKPFVLGNTRMVPLCKLTLGFGTGVSDASGRGAGRDGNIEAAGAGGALSVEPRAFVVIGPDGVPRMLSMRRGKRAVMQHAIEVGPNAADSDEER
jgi:uncharacterized spore protein YtfJ